MVCLGNCEASEAGICKHWEITRAKHIWIWLMTTDLRPEELRLHASQWGNADWYTDQPQASL